MFPTVKRKAEMFYVAILALFFLFISLVFSMLGLGGGLAYVPLLVLAGYTIKAASLISLFAILLASFSAFLVFFKSERFNWKLAAVIDPPTDIMAFIGGYYANLLPEKLLTICFNYNNLLAGILMVRRLRFRQLKSERLVWRRNFKGRAYTVNIPLTCLMTGIIGFFVGMVGVTGGVFKIPIMVLLCGVPIDIAIGTSSGMVFLTALFAFIGHLSTAGNVNWLHVIPIGASCLIGGIIGAKISVKAGKERLRSAYGISMFMLATLILIRKIMVTP